MSYYDDWAHAWTFFLIPYTQHYYRGGRVQWYGGHTLRAGPDGVLGEILDNSGAAWDALGAQASWERCVREGTGCDNDGAGANAAWAVFVLRFARLHGASAVRNALAFVKEFKNNQAAPLTPEAKNDLLVEALTAGASVDLSCELDAWRWTASSAARSRMAAKFSQANTSCGDKDHDGYSPLAWPKELSKKSV